MKSLMTLLAAGSAAILAATPMAAAHAQSADDMAVDSNATVAATTHGDWTLKQRENWLHDRLERARDDGSIDHAEYDRVRHRLDDIHHDEDQMRDRHEGGQLTDNENTSLEARLDGVADQIHWLHEDAFRRPW